MDAALPTSIRRIAVVCPSWVGDSVMCTPLLRALREQRPEALIALIARRNIEEVLRGLPFCDAILASDMKGTFGAVRIARAVRQSQAQAVVLLPNSFRSAMGARLSGVPIRIGYDRDGRGAMLTHKISPESTDLPVSLLDYYQRLGCFVLGVDCIDPRLELATSAEDEAAADTHLKGVRSPFVVLNPGANRPDKRWPAERFAHVADRLVKAHNVSIVVSGSPAEMEILQAIESAMEHPMTNLVKSGVRLGSLKTIIRRAALLITNDTGPRHMAAAFGTPTVTLFGPTDHRWTTLHNTRERILLAEPFLPEELVADRHAKACTIDKIATGDVLAVANDLLG